MSYDIESIIQAQRVLELESMLRKSRVIILESIPLFEAQPEIYNVDSVRKFITKIDACIGFSGGAK